MKKIFVIYIFILCISVLTFCACNKTTNDSSKPVEKQEKNIKNGISQEKIENMEKNNEETSNLGLDISILDVVDKEDITLVKRLIKENIKCENCEKVSCYCYISYSLALAKAVALDNQEIINLLLDATEKVDKKTVTKELLYLFHIESFKSVKILLNKVGIKNIDINAQDESNEHKTLLIYAVLYEQQELVQILIEAGAELNIEDAEGKTELDYATNDEIKDILLKAGAEKGSGFKRYRE